MNVKTEKQTIITYTFTKGERHALMDMGLWGFINARLLSNERIEVE
jgi:hypothetical protein